MPTRYQWYSRCLLSTNLSLDCAWLSCRSRKKKKKKKKKMLCLSLIRCLTVKHFLIYINNNYIYMYIQYNIKYIFYP